MKEKYLPRIGETVYNIDGIEAKVIDPTGLDLSEKYLLVELESGQQTTWATNKVYAYDPCELLLLTLRNHSKNMTLSTYATACAAVVEHMAMHIPLNTILGSTMSLTLGRHLRIVLTAIHHLDLKEGFPDGDF